MRHHVAVDHEAVFGGLLRRLRESAGLTQEELAGRADLSSKAVSLLERGERRRPYPHTIQALADALDLEPATREQLVAAARGSAGPTSPTTPGWPVPATSLVGRDHELGELCDLLLQPGPRLVTLTGTGGVGKTRLALALLDRVGGRFPDGAVFAPLAPVSRPELVVTTIVRLLGVDAVDRDPLEALRAHLSGRRMLLVVDNLEHLLDAAPDVAELVTVPDGPIVLVTSRAPLRVRGETEYALSPLWAPQGDALSTDAVAGSPAGRLFLERADAASPGFALTEDNAPDVAAICRRLSGIPLALEIAAARLRLVGPRQLLARLDRALYDEGARDLPERHRTLRRTVEWSNDLLDPSAQELLSRLSVFAGGFSLESAEVVGAAVPGETLTALGSLVEHALVLTEPSADGTEVRYRLLEPVAQFAAERLAAAGTEERTRLAHAEHFVELAEAAYPHTHRAEQIEWFDRLETEHDNLIQAIAWSLTAGRIDLAVRCAFGLRMYLLMRGGRVEVRSLLERALPQADELDTLLRARLFHVLAFCHYGFSGPQHELAGRALELFRELGDRYSAEYSLGQLGYALLNLGRLDEATRALEEALDLAVEFGDMAHRAHMLNHLAVVRLRRDELPEAADLAGRALACTDVTGERLSRQTAHQILGQVAWASDDLEQARAHFRASLEVARELSDRVNVAYSLRGLAICDGECGGTRESAVLLGGADRLMHDAGSPLFAWAVGRFDEASAAALEHRSAPEWASAYAAGRARDTSDIVHVLGAE